MPSNRLFTSQTFVSLSQTLRKSLHLDVQPKLLLTVQTKTGSARLNVNARCGIGLPAAIAVAGVGLAVLGFQTRSEAQMFSLGTAQNFAVLAGSTVTNTGSSVITGDIGVDPGTAVTGFGPGTDTGTIYGAGATTLQAQNDVSTSYNALAGMAVTQNLTGQDLGGKTLTPGVYYFSSAAQLTGTLTLNSLGNANALFVFQIGSTLTTATNSAVVFSSTGGTSTNVFWQVGSSATLGTTTDFMGNILAKQSVTLDTGASLDDGRALAENGAVTLDDNNISLSGVQHVSGSAGTFGSAASAPEPNGVLLMGSGSLSVLGLLWKSRRQGTKA